MKYEIVTSNRFKKNLKRCQKRGLNMRFVYDAMLLFLETGTHADIFGC